MSSVVSTYIHLIGTPVLTILLPVRFRVQKSMALMWNSAPYSYSVTCNNYTVVGEGDEHCFRTSTILLSPINKPLKCPRFFIESSVTTNIFLF